MRNDPGSFRDPAGCILHINNGVYRAVTRAGAAEYEFVSKSGLLDTLVKQHLLVPYEEVDKGLLESGQHQEISHLLQHPCLDFISYPYEWPFSVLQEAALTHLKVHLKALEKGITLSDATAYNIQFSGSQALFIDHLSFRRYVDGELWYGHRQFCDQFLNPLLLSNACGIPHNLWYRGSMEGISAVDLNKILPWHRKFSLNIFLHVTMQAYMQKKYQDIKPASAISRKLPLSALRNMLTQLYHWIESLKVPVSETSAWRDYTKTASYQTEEMMAKKSFVSDYVKGGKPEVVWDIGCNTGEFSNICLQSGARLVIGFDADSDVLDIAYLNAKKNNMAFLPLYMDITNPTPSQGWKEAERTGLQGRRKPDGILALALIHHLVIGNNIPLSEAVNWLLDLAPGGVIEFVPKHDPMVQKLLAYKKDIYPDYTEQSFMSLISDRSSVVQEKILTSDGRKLIWYRKH